MWGRGTKLFMTIWRGIQTKNHRNKNTMHWHSKSREFLGKFLFPFLGKSCRQLFCVCRHIQTENIQNKHIARTNVVKFVFESS